ncbi:hypothetical protein Salat_2129400 [Sesamum alatum]|uniref:Myb/SANT-like domain-containing protein n=1 Tax=Sesamum alatum TaxID=300844 RepID=A0AAE2CGY0_9LAMI|nr:hypothetical protein Salat_2129400 [Sesamum alatum]
MYNELCLLFGNVPNRANTVIDAHKFDLNAPPLDEDVVPLPLPTANADNKDVKAIKDDESSILKKDSSPYNMVKWRRFKLQRNFFYTPRWPKERDTCFINSQAWQAGRGRKQTNPEQPDLDSLSFAQAIINESSPIDFGIEFFNSKLELLRQRFTTFRRILQHPSFLWNAQTNRVIAAKKARAALVQWKLLHAIFSEQDEDVRLGEQAINCSVKHNRDTKPNKDVDDCMFMPGRDVTNEPEIVDLVTSDEEETK